MAYTKHTPELPVVSAKQKVVNKLCTVYTRYGESRFIPADELRRELGIPDNVFTEALKSFTNAENQIAVEVIENRSKGRAALRLGAFMRDICNDWIRPEARLLSSR